MEGFNNNEHFLELRTRLKDLKTKIAFQSKYLSTEDVNDINREIGDVKKAIARNLFLSQMANENTEVVNTEGEMQK